MDNEDDDDVRAVIAAIDDNDDDEALRLVEEDPSVLTRTSHSYVMDADGRITYESWETPLTYAASMSNDYLASKFIECQWRNHLAFDKDEIQEVLCYASEYSLPDTLAAVLRLAKADPAKTHKNWDPPLFLAARAWNAEALAFLLRYDAVRAGINLTNRKGHTALSWACSSNRDWCEETDVLDHIQVLLACGADPALPQGPNEPLSICMARDFPKVAALLRQIIETPRTLALCKVRDIHDAAHGVARAFDKARAEGLPMAAMQRSLLKAAPATLRKRVAWGRELPTVAVEDADDATLQAVVRFTTGSGDGCMPRDVFLELLEYMERDGVNCMEECKRKSVVEGGVV